MDRQQNRPVEINLKRGSRTLSITWSDGFESALPWEYLRVFSPSAEVRGHGPGQETLVSGKKTVAITGVEGVGNYAVKLVFDDGHDSGIYDWNYLRELGEHRSSYWESYLARLVAAGASREAAAGEG